MVRWLAGRKLFAGIALLVAVLAANAGVNARNTRRLDSDAAWVAHTHEVMDALEELLGNLRDAEAGHRGYLLTGRPNFLPPYTAARGSAAARIARVETLTRDNPRQQARFPRLKELVAAKYEVMGLALALHDLGLPAAAREVVAAARGKQLMDDLRALVGEMQAEEQRLLGEREAARADAYAVAVGSAAAMLLVGLVAVGATVGLGVHSVREQGRAAAEAARHGALAEEGRRRDELLARLKEGEDRFRAFMDHCPAVAYMKDEAGRFVYVNEPLAAFHGHPVAAWLGKTDHDFFPAEFADDYRRHDQEVMAGGATVSLESSPAADGGVTHWRSYKFPFADGGGRRLLAGMSVDVTAETRAAARLAEYQAELERANARLRALATTDALTGVRNRAAFDDRLAEEFDRAARYGHPLSLVLLDVDHFKAFNDAFGHPAGDRVLRGVADTLARAVRTTDAVARYGGEEFAVILPDTDHDGAVAMAERCRQAVAGEDWPDRAITVSVGVATLDPDTATATAMLAGADEALYRSKRAGRNRVNHLSGVVPMLAATTRE